MPISSLWNKSKIIVLQWNNLAKQHGIIEDVKCVEKCKEQEVKVIREEQAK